MASVQGVWGDTQQIASAMPLGRWSAHALSMCLHTGYIIPILFVYIVGKGQEINPRDSWKHHSWPWLDL